MTKSPDFICQQNRPVVRHAKIARFCWPTKSPNFVGQDRACSIFDNFVGRHFVYRTTNFFFFLPWWLFTTEDEYLF